MLLTLFVPTKALFTSSDFNPNLIITDEELNHTATWTKQDIQDFLFSKGSFLKNYWTPDVNGVIKSAADIIYEASQTYSINPKFLVVTLQKEQSLITDDSPANRQLDWATGFAVCDGCNLSDPRVLKFKGFGKQVDGAASIMRWYYDNEGKSFIKKKDSPIRIDDQEITPGSWATAFLYTYTPHIHGNKNFWNIWNTWFSSNYPNGTLLQSRDTGEYWLLNNNQRRNFKNKTALITRVNPKTAIVISEVDLKNYPLGPSIAFPNYSILRNASTTYLVDHDEVRAFANDEVVRQLGYNPDEIIDITDTDLLGYATGTIISATTTEPLGIIYQITDLNNRYYLLKNGTLYPVLDRSIIESNFQKIVVEKHTRAELFKYPTADSAVGFSDGTLLRSKISSLIFVIENGKRRRIGDAESFLALGYKHSNLVLVPPETLQSIPEGEALFVNTSLLTSRNKYLGDSSSPVEDLFTTKIPSYLVAEFPSGRIVSGKSIDKRLPLASLTKILTAYEVLEQDFNEAKTVTLPVNFNNESVKLKKGDVIKNSDLLLAALVGSVNDAVTLLPTSIGSNKNEILSHIHDRLEAWGTEATTIIDVSGKSPENKSSARDLLKIATKVFTNKKIIQISSTKSVTLKLAAGPNKNKKILVTNTNQLLKTNHKEYAILASNTGYLAEFGHNAMMLIEVPKTKKRYLLITLGNPDLKNPFVEPNKLTLWVSKTVFNN